MGYTRPEHWDAHYAVGHGFRRLGDAERRILAHHCPARRPGTFEHLAAEHTDTGRQERVTRSEPKER
jgi:lipopolysaccharide biosynthesis regulator YciM